MENKSKRFHWSSSKIKPPVNEEEDSEAFEDLYRPLNLAKTHKEGETLLRNNRPVSSIEEIILEEVDQKHLQEDFLFFQAALKQTKTTLYHNTMLFLSLASRAHIAVGPTLQLLDGISLTFVQGERKILCEISDKIVVTRFLDNVVTQKSIVLGWAQMSRHIAWLLSAF
jgi:hypothetical protein